MLSISNRMLRNRCSRGKPIGSPLAHVLREPICRFRSLATPEDSAEDSPEDDKETLSNALARSLSEVAKARGRTPLGTNILLVNDNSQETWQRLDRKVNTYPAQRSFTAIGSGGNEFKAAMVAAVSEVVGYVHQECVSERQSTQGKYLSVTVGPVWIENGDQVVKVYENMKTDARLKWLI